MKLFPLIAIVVMALPSAAGACTKHNPCPVVAFNPPMPTEMESAPVGTVISTITVTLSPSSAGQFTGTIAFGPPYGNDSGILALSGHDIVLAKPFPPGSSTQHGTIVATQ